jgi:UDP:flavonoid glycosyltransferase YjiC (YdhE family)
LGGGTPLADEFRSKEFSMRVALFAAGTHGDVRPMVALGTRLTEAGHDVLVAAEERFTTLVTSAGLRMQVLAGDVQTVTDLSAEQVVLGKLKWPAGAPALLLEMAENWASEGMAAVEGADLLIAVAGATPLAAALVEKTGIPLVVVHPHPGGLVRQIPMVRTPGLNELLMGVHPFSWWWPFAKGINTCVRPELGLPRGPWYGPDYGIRRRRVPKLFAFSPTLVPARGTVPDFAKVTGFWTLDTREIWQPPSELTDFLAAGPAPVYLGFGSMPDPRPDLTAELIVDALRMTKHRAVVATGWSGANDFGDALGGDRLIVVREAPHDWLLPQVHAAVHHCGAGTTAAAVRAGVPTVPVPFWSDQFLWSRVLTRAGAAPKGVRRPRLTAERLAAGIDATDAPQMREAAMLLGERVRAEDGIATAIDALNTWNLLH